MKDDAIERMKYEVERLFRANSRFERSALIEFNELVKRKNAADNECGGIVKVCDDDATVHLAARFHRAMIRASAAKAESEHRQREIESALDELWEHVRGQYGIEQARFEAFDPIRLVIEIDQVKKLCASTVKAVGWILESASNEHLQFIRERNDAAFESIPDAAEIAPARDFVEEVAIDLLTHGDKARSMMRSVIQDRAYAVAVLRKEEELPQVVCNLARMMLRAA